MATFFHIHENKVRINRLHPYWRQYLVSKEVYARLLRIEENYGKDAEKRCEINGFDLILYVDTMNKVHNWIWSMRVEAKMAYVTNVFVIEQETQ